jgi:hypothetical protein
MGCGQHFYRGHFLFFNAIFYIVLFFRYQDVIVFIVGGGCYSEFYNLQVSLNATLSVTLSLIISHSLSLSLSHTLSHVQCVQILQVIFIYLFHYFECTTDYLLISICPLYLPFSSYYISFLLFISPLPSSSPLLSPLRPFPSSLPLLSLSASELGFIETKTVKWRIRTQECHIRML